MAEISRNGKWEKKDNATRRKIWHISGYGTESYWWWYIVVMDTNEQKTIYKELKSLCDIVYSKKFVWDKFIEIKGNQSRKEARRR